MDNTPLQVCVTERDIGVQIYDNLTLAIQCVEAAQCTNAILTQIFRAFLYRDPRVFLQFYKQFIRCLLKFSTPAWSPWQSGDIEVLERVQRKAVRLINGPRGNNYEKRLAELDLKTLEERRVRIDLIQTYKTL